MPSLCRAGDGTQGTYTLDKPADPPSQALFLTAY